MGQGPAPAGRHASSTTSPRAGAGARLRRAGRRGPGAVDAWLLLLRDHGTWELADVLAFAIGYARDGHPLLGRVGATIAAVRELFTEHWPTSAELWMPGGRIPAPGELVRNPAYARVLRTARSRAGAGGADGREARIDAARAEWATGSSPRGRRLPAHAAPALLRHRPRRRASPRPTSPAFERRRTRRRHRSSSAATRSRRPAPGGRGRRCCRRWRSWTGSTDELLDPSTELGAHTILEAQKLALGRPGRLLRRRRDVPLDCAALRRVRRRAPRADRRRGPRTSSGRAASRAPTPYLPPLRTEYTPPRAGSGDRRRGRGSASASRPCRATGETRGDTCHIDVVDRWGNMVSATPSGGWLQSSPTIPELGFCLGTRLQMTWLEPGTPSTLTPGTPAAHHADADAGAARRPRR